MLKRARVTQNRDWLIILLLLLALLIVIIMLIISPGERTLAVACEPSDRYAQPVPPNGFARTRHLVDQQVIIMGPAAAVDAVVAELQGQGLGSVPLRDCDLSFLTRLVGRDNLAAPYFPFPPQSHGTLVMRLYPIVDGRPVEAVIAAVNRVGNSRSVFADPNYLTGHLAQSACSDPYSVGGSPYSVGGSPYSVGGSPAGGSSPAAADLFWQQWAFEHIGVGTSVKDGLKVGQAASHGAAVRVGVFDTSPFTATLPGGPSTLETITAISPALTLGVSHPLMPALSATNPAALADVREHGLFVAGLIHAVAPQSQIQLVRVLNEYGCGDLFALNEALFQFVAGIERDRKALGGAVINLSLGVHKPGPEDIEAQETSPILVEDPLESLRAAISLAHSRGVVIVAASGNDSYLEDSPLAPQVPAAYPFVVGVSASNINRQRACFSNWGDVAAPGGDGGPDDAGLLSCLPQTADCVGNCKQAVMSLALSSPTDYLYWSGTSFSAPLVSGLAALVLDAGGHGSAWLAPEQVFNTIRCGSPTPDGVINVPAALSRCLPP